MATNMTCDKVRELASGFVLGALDTDEMIAVQDHLDTCAEAHSEIDDLGSVVSYLAVAVEPAEPPEWLRESVIAAARADLQASRRVGKVSESRVAEPVPAVAATAAEPALFAASAEPAAAAERNNVISLTAARLVRGRRAIAYGITAMAAVIALIVAGVTFVIPGQAADPSRQMLNVIGQTGTRVLEVKGPVNGVIALQPTGHLYVQLSGLEQTRGDEVYVVWVTGSNGAVSKIGTFRVDGSGSVFLQLDGVPTSASLWVNICKEPNDKVTKPTGPTVASGTIPL